MYNSYEYRMGNCYTEAQCEAKVMCGNNHWILRQPDEVSKIDPWSGGPKSNTWQPVIASLVIQQTTTVCGSSILVYWMTGEAITGCHK